METKTLGDLSTWILGLVVIFGLYKILGLMGL